MMNTPALQRLMAGYLHQDSDLVGDVEDNIDLFVNDSPDLAAGLPAEIDWVLSSHRGEHDLDDLLEQLGCELLPPEGQSYRAWLAHIADRVRRATAG